MNVEWNHKFLEDFSKEFVKHPVLWRRQFYRIDCKGTYSNKNVEALMAMKKVCTCKVNSIMQVRDICKIFRFKYADKMSHLLNLCIRLELDAWRALADAPPWMHWLRDEIETLPTFCNIMKLTRFQNELVDCMWQAMTDVHKSPSTNNTMVPTHTFQYMKHSNTTCIVDRSANCERYGKTYTGKTSANIEREMTQRGIDCTSIECLAKKYDISLKCLQEIWLLIRELVIRKLEALAQGYYSEQCTMLACDWRLADWLLLHDDQLTLYSEDDLHSQTTKHLLQPLELVFYLVTVHQLEECPPQQKEVRWRKVLTAYNMGRPGASMLLLQRWWHELKRQTHAALAALWLRVAHGHDAPKPMPLRIHRAVAHRYPHVVTRPVPPWAELVRTGHVVTVHEVADDGGARRRGNGAAELSTTEDANDLIIVEKDIPTIELEWESDESDDRLFIDTRSTNTIKREPDDEIAKEYKDTVNNNCSLEVNPKTLNIQSYDVPITESALKMAMRSNEINNGVPLKTTEHSSQINTVRIKKENPSEIILQINKGEQRFSVASEVNNSAHNAEIVQINTAMNEIFEKNFHNIDTKNKDLVKMPQVKNEHCMEMTDDLDKLNTNENKVPLQKITNNNVGNKKKITIDFTKINGESFIQIDASVKEVSQEAVKLQENIKQIRAVDMDTDGSEGLLKGDTDTFVTYSNRNIIINDAQENCSENNLIALLNRIDPDNAQTELIFESEDESLVTNDTKHSPTNIIVDTPNTANGDISSRSTHVHIANNIPADESTQEFNVYHNVNSETIDMDVSLSGDDIMKTMVRKPTTALPKQTGYFLNRLIHNHYQKYNHKKEITTICRKSNQVANNDSSSGESEIENSSSGDEVSSNSSSRTTPLNNCVDFCTGGKLFMDAQVPLVRIDDNHVWNEHFYFTHFQHVVIKTIKLSEIDVQRLQYPKLITKHNEFNSSTSEATANGKRVHSVAFRDNRDYNRKIQKLVEDCKMLNEDSLNLLKPVTIENLEVDSVKIHTARKSGGRITKKIELSDIEEVRRINKEMLTAQVAPMTINTKGRDEDISMNINVPNAVSLKIENEQGGDERLTMNVDVPIAIDLNVNESGDDSSIDITIPNSISSESRKLKKNNNYTFEFEVPPIQPSANKTYDKESNVNETANEGTALEQESPESTTNSCENEAAMVFASRRRQHHSNIGYLLCGGNKLDIVNYIREKHNEESKENDVMLPTHDELMHMLYCLQKHTQRVAQYCCAARRMRAQMYARRRMAQRAGRQLAAACTVRAMHDRQHSKSCDCCCLHLLQEPLCLSFACPAALRRVGALLHWRGTKYTYHCSNRHNLILFTSVMRAGQNIPVSSDAPDKKKKYCQKTNKSSPNRKSLNDERPIQESSNDDTYEGWIKEKNRIAKLYGFKPRPTIIRDSNDSVPPSSQVHPPPSLPTAPEQCELANKQKSTSDHPIIRPITLREHASTQYSRPEANEATFQENQPTTSTTNITGKNGDVHKDAHTPDVDTLRGTPLETIVQPTRETESKVDAAHTHLTSIPRTSKDLIPATPMNQTLDLIDLTGDDCERQQQTETAPQATPAVKSQWSAISPVNDKVKYILMKPSVEPNGLIVLTPTQELKISNEHTVREHMLQRKLQTTPFIKKVNLSEILKTGKQVSHTFVENMNLPQEVVQSQFQNTHEIEKVPIQKETKKPFFKINTLLKVNEAITSIPEKEPQILAPVITNVCSLNQKEKVISMNAAVNAVVGGGMSDADVRAFKLLKRAHIAKTEDTTLNANTRSLAQSSKSINAMSNVEVHSPGENPKSKNALSDAKPVKAADYVAGRDPTSLNVLCLDESQPVWRLRGDYLVITNTCQKFTQPKLYTASPGAQAELIVEEGEASAGGKGGAILTAPETIQLQDKVFQKILDNPLVYAQVLYILSSTHQCRAIITSDKLSLYLYCVRTSRVHAVARAGCAPAPRAACGLVCSNTGALAALVAALNADRRDDVIYIDSGDSDSE